MIGSQLLHYRILRQLGAGGMGVVFEAFDTKLERSVALKFLSDGLLHNPTALERFSREAKAVSRLDHPNIGSVFALEQTANQTFLAMAMYQGSNLAERLGRGPLGLPEAFRIALEMARGLEHAHGQGVVHRDIKPANIFLAKMPNGSELIKILDFGLARLEDSSQQITRPGATTGTLLYMSPEQLSGNADAQSDLWAWGAVVYELLAGRPVFDVDGIGALLNAILHTQAQPIRELRPETPRLFADLVMQALSKNPQDRPEGMQTIVQTLESLVSGEQLLQSHNADVSLMAAVLSTPEPAVARATVSELPRAVASEPPRAVASEPPRAVVSEPPRATVSEPPRATVSEPPRAADSLIFDNPSSWDNAVPSAVIDTTKEEMVIRLPRRRFPWLVALSVLVVLVVGAWFLVPRSPAFERCEPLNTTGQMLDSAIKWSVPLTPLENCGSFGFGQASATAEYPDATAVNRQVLALLPGTVLVADAVQHKTETEARVMVGAKGKIEPNEAFSNGGEQFFVGGENKVLTVLYPSYLETAVSGEALTVRSTEPAKQTMFLKIYQVDEVDTDVQRLDVTTSDEHTQNFVGALFGGKTAVFLGVGANATPANFRVNVPLGITRYIITNMPPGKSYDMEFEPDRGWNYITLKPGRSGTVNSAGVLVLGEKMKSIR